MDSIETKLAKIYAHALNEVVELGPIKLARMLNYFGDYKNAWQAKQIDYQSAGLDEKTILAIEERKKIADPLASFELLEKSGIAIVLSSDKEYPKQLAEIHSFPPIFYARGNVDILNNLSIGVIGTRKMSLYGKQAVEEIVPTLVNNRLNIVSGLAFGVDAQALGCCVESGGVPVAILATSIDNASISPRANYNLAQKIIEQGCLISEYPTSASTQKQNFPIRNRLISGLSVGTLVIEADVESGALITANYALDQNREVFAVPGSIFSPYSRGTNALIKKGAKMVTSAFDIIEELNLDMAVEVAEIALAGSENEVSVLSILTREPLHIDDLIKQIQMPVPEVNATLTLLEMKGRIKNLGGARYVKVR